jgi:hypothetical protein
MDPIHQASRAGKVVEHKCNQDGFFTRDTCRKAGLATRDMHLKDHHEKELAAVNKRLADAKRAERKKP